jgi:hypothetical protein
VCFSPNCQFEKTSWFSKCTVQRLTASSSMNEFHDPNLYVRAYVGQFADTVSHSPSARWTAVLSIPEINQREREASTPYARAIELVAHAQAHLPHSPEAKNPEQRIAAWCGITGVLLSKNEQRQELSLDWYPKRQGT